MKIRKKYNRCMFAILAIIMSINISTFSAGAAAQNKREISPHIGALPTTEAGTANGRGNQAYWQNAHNQYPNFAGPVDMAQWRAYIDTTTHPVDSNVFQYRRLWRVTATEANLITKPIAHFSIRSQNTGNSITTQGRRQVMAGTPAGAGAGYIDVAQENLILTVEVGDTIVFTCHSIHSSAHTNRLRQPPRGVSVGTEANSHTNFTLRHNFQVSATPSITPAVFPALDPSNREGTWLPAGTSLVLTEAMLGEHTFFYNVADWQTAMGHAITENVGPRGVYNPVSWDGEGGGNAGYINNSQNGNYWVFDANDQGGAMPGGVFYHFQALRIRVVPASETPPPPPPPPPAPGAGAVIQKIDALTRQNIPGALMRLRGLSSHQVVTGDGGIWELDNTGINISQVLTSGAVTVAPNGVTSTVTDGIWILEGLPFGAYIVEEERAPQNYSLLPQHTAYAFWLLPPNIIVDGSIDQSQIVVHPDTGAILSVPPVDFEVIEHPSGGDINAILITFENFPFGAIELQKLCEISGRPIQGAVFMVEGYSPEGNQSGIPIQRMETTDALGRIRWEDLPAGMYTITEISAAAGFMLDTGAKTVPLTWGQTATVVVTNTPMSSLEIMKIDAVLGTPIAGAVFELRNPTTGETWQAASGTAGAALLGRGANGNELFPGTTYILTEIQAPIGYVLNSVPQEIVLSPGDNNRVTIRNTKLPTLVITKMNALTNRPVPLTHFRVEFEVPNSSSVQLVGNFVTDNNGQIILPLVNVGWYRITETRAAPGMALSTNNNHRVFLNPGDNTYRLPDIISSQDSDPPPQPAPQSPDTSEPNIGNMQVTDGDAHQTGENIFNWPLNSIVIKKTDAATGQLLQGATFELIHVSSGESGTRGTVIGRFTTNHSGIIVITGLQPGTYVVEEVVPPPNYTLSVNNRQHVNLRPDGFSIVEVEFSNLPYGGLLITKRCETTGRPLQNAEFRVTDSGGAVVGTANGLFRTNQQGEILIPNLSPGSYIITEITAPIGFELNSTPQTIQINATGQIYRVDFTNRPLGGLQIIKLNSITREPISGAEFAVSRITGERIGAFRTNNLGIINVSGLEPGWYTVTETQAADGFFLDSEPRNIEVAFGETATLEVLNTPMSGIRLRKIDAISRAPIFGVEFMLFDSNNRVVKRLITDNNGVIDFFGIEPGRYTIRETRAAPGYYLDEMPKTVEFVQGRVTEILWENTPQMGQIQIMKLSGDDNQINGLPAGTPLAGAVFEVSDFRTGNVLDRFESGADGRAVSRPLPLGRYLVREVRAPQRYMLSTQVLDIVIEFPTQIIRQNFLNYSANTGVVIRKTGNMEAMPGDAISYTIREIQNTSTVPLTDFFWRDVLPTDAVRLSKIVTGTYNQALQYRVIAATNRGETIILADNLSTTRNNVIDTNPVAIGLRNDEYITSFTFIFGKVQAGFTLVEQPQIFVNVLQNLSNDYQFVNRVDAGGKHGDEWVINRSVWVTTIFAKPIPLPRTGW